MAALLGVCTNSFTSSSPELRRQLGIRRETPPELEWLVLEG